MTDERKPYAYDPIAVSDESTVVARYFPEGVRELGYQSEAELETAFLRILVGQAYEHLTIASESDLIANLRNQLELLNIMKFSDAEWTRFFEEHIAKANEGIAEKTVRIQEDPVQLLTRDDGTTKNVKLMDRRNVHNNRLQVMNQYEAVGARANRYDVTVLVNGLPMVHVELKRRGVDIREAFHQIQRYGRDSFWAGSALFEYVQLFVISNGTLTKYYSNTTRRRHIEDSTGAKKSNATSNSFEFTSWWADETNRPIQDLTAFAKTFFTRHTLLSVLTRYCVLTADRTLLVMRPYQIAATERILQRIEMATNHRLLGTVEAGGYVWHTTGSGKTLTSFKTAQLACKLPSVDKVLFVVDRKDLDYQTMREYDRFEKGAANSNTSTAVLKKQLEDPEARIIITTIQKLAGFISANKGHDIFGRHVVIVFDECHRSQFGDMHSAITRAFKRYHLFGFTGTPIFAANRASGGNPRLKTTEQAFGERLHSYTIVDAISDKNVLPFRIDYVNTLKVGEIADKKVVGIDVESAMLHPDRIRQVVEYVREHFDQKTKREVGYTHSRITNVGAVASGRNRIVGSSEKRHVRGFNALFATASITAAKHYYAEFASQQQDVPPDRRLTIGIIYSFAANEAVEDGILDEEGFEPEALDGSSRDFLDAAIRDYNAAFGTSYDTSSEKFQNYYKDVSLRMKNRELDLLIVVNMFLTGFDATTLNTLFADKNLRAHGLIQAYSRTNRILNSVKAYGNIVTFRDLAGETDDALALFGDKEAKSVVILKPYQEFYAEYETVVEELRARFPVDGSIVGEQAQREFIELFGRVLRLENVLRSFDEFADNELLSLRDAQDYQSVYLGLYADRRNTPDDEREPIHENVVFEIELIKQVEIDVDYILMLVAEYRASSGDGQGEEFRARISRAVDSSPTLRSKKDLIEEFVESVSAEGDTGTEWREFIAARREAELERIIEEENLQSTETHVFVENSFRDARIRTTGTEISRILPPTSRFEGNEHGEKKRRVLAKLSAFFERFYTLTSTPSE